jgi:hypothetical protein
MSAAWFVRRVRIKHQVAEERVSVEQTQWRG